MLRPAIGVANQPCRLPASRNSAKHGVRDQMFRHPFAHRVTGDFTAVRASQAGRTQPTLIDHDRHRRSGLKLSRIRRWTVSTSASWARFLPRSFGRLALAPHLVATHRYAQHSAHWRHGVVSSYLFNPHLTSAASRSTSRTFRGGRAPFRPDQLTLDLCQLDLPFCQWLSVSVNDIFQLAGLRRPPPPVCQHLDPPLTLSCPRFATPRAARIRRVSVDSFVSSASDKLRAPFVIRRNVFNTS